MSGLPNSSTGRVMHRPRIEIRESRSTTPGRAFVDSSEGKKSRAMRWVARNVTTALNRSARPMPCWDCRPS